VKDLDKKLENIIWEAINTSGNDPETQSSRDAIYFATEKIKKLIEDN
jgi:adenine specific DNA methylase Mod